MSDDVLWVRNVARYPVRIGREFVQPGEVWTGERGFVMIALQRYPGRLEFVEPSPPAPLPESGEGGGSEDNRLLSSGVERLEHEGARRGAKARRRKAKADE